MFPSSWLKALPVYIQYDELSKVSVYSKPQIERDTVPYVLTPFGYLENSYCLE